MGFLVGYKVGTGFSWQSRRPELGSQSEAPQAKMLATF